MKVKSYTFTFCHSHNMGAMLQSYALQKTLESLGHENYIIDIEEKEKLFHQLKGDLRYLHRRIQYNFVILKNYLSYKRKFESYEEFYNKKLKTIRLEYMPDRIKHRLLDANYLVVGSDQVWNPELAKDLLSVFLLEFNEKVPCYSYAASIGDKNMITEQYGKRLENSLRKYSGVSIRESDTQRYLIEHAYCEKAETHLDPVFLMDKGQWNELIDSTSYYKHKLPEKYILYYDLVFSPYLEYILTSLKEMTGFPIVVISQGERLLVKGDYILKDVGPVEFLDLIRKAEVVVSTSFHGVAFSVLFQKCFFAVPTYCSPNRMEDLLNKLGLRERLVASENKLMIDINYSLTNEIILREKERSYTYLRQMR